MSHHSYPLDAHFIDGRLNLRCVLDTRLRHPVGDFSGPLANRTRHSHPVLEALKIRTVLATVLASTPAVELVERRGNPGRYPVRVPHGVVRELRRIQYVRGVEYS
jgi:hypothetical protein